MLLRLSPDAALDWLVVSTQPHRERVALEHLDRQGFNAYCPMIRRRIRHARRSEEVRRPLFPGYLFVEYDADRAGWRPILGTRGVRSLICTGELPSTLPAAVIKAFRAREIDGCIAGAAERLKVGQEAIIDGGALDCLVGRIIEVRENERIVLLVSLLNQQTRVVVPADQLRPAGQPAL